jgi:monofunctional glycosyltransferase
VLYSILWIIHNFILKIIVNTLDSIITRSSVINFDLVKQKLSKNKHSELLLDALILAEDRRYLLHSGVDLIGILRALLVYTISGKLQGASTIEQQFVRTVTLDNRITLSRKIREQKLAIMIAEFTSKKTIANSYLDIAYFGWKMNGIKSSCTRLRYDINHLNIDQVSHLIAMLRYPMPKIPNIVRLKQIKNRKRFIKKCLLKIYQTGLQASNTN